jgi:hypothetical protein
MKMEKVSSMAGWKIKRVLFIPHLADVLQRTRLREEELVKPVDPNLTFTATTEFIRG